MKKTIGYFDDSVRTGGTTRYLLNVAAGLDRKEFDLVFFAPRPWPWHEELTAAGIEVYTALPAEPPSESAPPSAPPAGPATPPKALGWWAGLAKEIATLRGLFRRRHVDILHSNNAGAEPGPIAARLAGVPIVLATWHVDSTYDLAGIRSSPRYRLLEKACMRSLHHAISCSKATATDWIARCALGDAYWRKVTVVYNGVRTEDFFRVKSVENAKAEMGLSGRLVIGSVGRLEPAKGFEYLIRSMPELLRHRPDILVRIAGRGELQAELGNLARSLGVDANIEILGFVDDLRAYLEAIDIYVQPSLCEAHPLSVLEACSVGLPIVASGVGGVAESVREGEMGTIVPPRQPDALAHAILRLAEDPQARARMALESARVVRQDFQCGQMVAGTVEVYRRLLG